MSIKLYKVAGILSLVILGACSPGGADYIEELDIVYTNYSSEYNFQSKKTYAIPDSVIKITGEHFNNPGSGRPPMVNPVYGNVIISELKKNMAANGWTLVPKTSNPDVFILPSAMTTTNIYYWYDWAYWGWYYPGWYPGWGWYYPGYYPGYVSGYRSGSVFVQMVDGTPKPAGENIPVVWTAIFNGLAEGETAGINARITNGIGQAFSQSPYLKK